MLVLIELAHCFNFRMDTSAYLSIRHIDEYVVFDDHNYKYSCSDHLCFCPLNNINNCFLKLDKAK